jgi:hypothetical protein
MGSGISSREKKSEDAKQLKPSKQNLTNAEQNGIIDPRILLGQKCSPELAELSEAVMRCSVNTKWVCMKLCLEHSRDFERHVAKTIDATSNSAVMKDRLEIAKNITHNIVQAVIWGDQAEFVSTTRHRVIPDSKEFKLNYQGALERSKLKSHHCNLSYASRMTSQQAPPSRNGHFPACMHYWWKSVDMMAIILNYVPLQQLSKVSLVHSAWYIASKKVAQVTLTRPIPGDRLLEALQYYENLFSLQIVSMYNVYPGVWFSVFSYALQNFKQLTTLTLKDCSSVVDQDLVPLCEHCVSLQSLSLLALAGLVRPKITSITLANLRIEDCAWFEEIEGFIPCITEVSLVRLNCMFGAGFGKTCMLLGVIDEIGNSSSLQSFTLRQCNGVTDLIVRNPSVKTIRVLVCGTLASCTVVASNANLLTVAQCPMLNSIEIQAPLLDRVVIQDVKSLSNAEILCPAASHVTFQDINHTTAPVLQRAVKNFKSMKSCRMVNIGAANRFPFGSDFQSFKTIISLFISNCAFDDYALSVLAQFEKLKNFEIWDCAALACPRFDFPRSLKSFSCNHCPNIMIFDIHAAGVTEFVISQCHILKELKIHAVKLKSLVINACDKISVFHIESDALDALDIDSIYKLDTFSCNLPALQKVSIKHAHEPPQLATLQALFKNKNVSTVNLDDLSGFLSFDRFQHQPEWAYVRELNLSHLHLSDNACSFLNTLIGMVRLSMFHCNNFYQVTLDRLPELKSLIIDESSHLSHIVIDGPKITSVFIQNCPHLLSATVSGRHLEALSFRKTDSIFMLRTVHGCPALKTISFSKTFDIQAICEAFCDAPDLLVQFCNQTHIVKMGELQMRSISQSEH